MGAALIVDAGAATIAVGPVLTDVTAGAGSTFTVRNTNLSSKVQLLDAFMKGAAVGQLRITSPNLVPVTNGIRIQTPTGLADFLLPGPPFQELIPQDTLDVQADGTAADIYVACLQSWYDDLPGGSPVLKMPGDVAGATDFVFGWPVAAAAPATEGDQASTVITTTVDSSIANRWYALLGYVCDTSVAAVGLKGTDTSQLFVGGPGDTDPVRTRNYFADLAVRSGKPCVPLFNAANKAATNIVVVDNAASTAVNVTMILAQLSKTYQP